MKILHTSDWHLGKRLCGKPRIDEQRDVLSEIAQIADEHNVDAVIVAGDIFDTSVPPAEAEELFFASCARMAQGRCFIAVAGNHDDRDRLCAPSGIAKALNIFLMGGEGKSVKSENYETGDGFVKIRKAGEKMNIAVCSYPQHSALATGENKDKPYTELVKNRFSELGKVFEEDSYNVLVTHVFATPGGNKDDSVLTDERTLGTAALLPESVFPPCDYTALGHIHKPLSVSKSKNILYGGSILSYSFDDLSDKSVVIAEFSGIGKDKKVAARRVPLKSGRRLKKITANNFEEAEAGLKENSDCFIHLIYEGKIPLTLSEMNELKKYDSFCSFQNAVKNEKRVLSERKERPVKEQFEDFYKFIKKTDSLPPEDMTDMFLKVLNGEEIV